MKPDSNHFTGTDISKHRIARLKPKRGLPHVAFEKLRNQSTQAGDGG
jgi:hypothetical protein